MSDRHSTAAEFRIPVHRPRNTGTMQYISEDATLPAPSSQTWDWTTRGEMLRNWSVLDPPWPSAAERFRAEFGKTALQHWGFEGKPASLLTMTAAFQRLYNKQAMARLVHWDDNPLHMQLHAQWHAHRHGIDEDASPYWKSSVRRPWYAGIMDLWRKLWRSN